MIRQGTSLLLAEQGLAEFGKQMTFVAVPLVAVLVLDLGAGPVATLVLVSAMSAIGGATLNSSLVKRVPIRRLVVVATVTSSACLTAIPLLHAFDLLTIWALGVAVGGVGLVGPVYRVGVITLVPKLVPADRYVVVNARINLVQSVVAIACPLLVGGTAVVVPPVYLITVNAVTWLVSGVVMSSLLRRARVRDVDPGGPEGGGDSLRNLASLFRDHRIVSGIASEGVLALCRAAVTTVLALYILDELRFSAFAVGAAYSVGGVGFVAGATLATFAGSSMTYHRVLRLATVLSLVCAVGLLASVVGRYPAVVGIAVFAASSAMGFLLLEVALTSWRQANLAEVQLARVASVADGVGTAARLAGAGLAGVVGELTGVSAVVVGAGVLYLATATLMHGMSRLTVSEPSSAVRST